MNVMFLHFSFFTCVRINDDDDDDDDDDLFLSSMLLECSMN